MLSLINYTKEQPLIAHSLCTYVLLSLPQLWK